MPKLFFAIADRPIPFHNPHNRELIKQSAQRSLTP